VAVRKNIVDSLRRRKNKCYNCAKKELRMSLMTSPIGIAAYVGKGEINPIRAAEMMAMYSFLMRNDFFCRENIG